MSSESKDKVSFGPLRATNPNWIKLQSEATQWQKDNRDTPWPTPSNFASIHPTWAQFRVAEFAYRFSKVKEMVDSVLGIEQQDADCSKFLIYGYFLQG